MARNKIKAVLNDRGVSAKTLSDGIEDCSTSVLSHIVTGKVLPTMECLKAMCAIRAGGFPFDVRLDDRPNRETIAALLEADGIAKDPNAKRYHSVKELFSDLEDDKE